jgi:TIR domain-containing protein
MRWDIFMSHASEDKQEVAEPLAVMLGQQRLQIWFDKFTLTVGDSLRRKIDEGLAQSRFGLVILSKSFFQKEWPQKELDGLVAREDGKEKRILPVWHNITKQEILSFSPMLADRLAVSTSTGLPKVVEQIMRAVQSKPAAELQSPRQAQPRHSLSAQAVELLREAAGGDGMIITMNADVGLVVMTTTRQFSEPGIARSEALYRQVIRTLQSAGFIERTNQGGSSSEVYKVSLSGFELIDSLK